MTDRAYSYIRFSGKRQERGDSLRRQRSWAPAWCAKRGVPLDPAGSLLDLGVSGFGGANVKEGAFAGFLEAVRGGKVPRGSFLLLEHLDRLSRDEILPAFRLFCELLEAGITVVTFLPEEREYTAQNVNNMGAIMTVLAIFAAAHEESAKKSKRLGEVWADKRVNAAAKPLTKCAPRWLRLNADKTGWDKIPERVAIVVLMFKWAIEGCGAWTITKRLNSERVPTMGNAGQWTQSYVYSILTGRAVLGEYQPRRREGKNKKATAGEPVKGYYPAVLSEEDWYRAQAAVQGRKETRGPRGKNVKNLFTGLLRDARDKSKMHVKTKMHGAYRDFLASSDAIAGKPGTLYRAMPYALVEECFLRCVLELKPSDIVGGKVDESEERITELTAKETVLRAKRERVKARVLTEEDTDSLLDIVRSLDVELASVGAAIEKIKQDRLSSPAETLGETQSLIKLVWRAKPGQERETLRSKIKARIHQLVSEMWLVAWHEREMGGNVAELQVFFKDGNSRSLVVNRPRLQFLRERAKRLAGAAPDDRDNLGGFAYTPEGVPLRSRVSMDKDLRSYSGWYDELDDLDDK